MLSDNIATVRAEAARLGVEVPAANPGAARAALNHLFGTSFARDVPLFSCMEAWGLAVRRAGPPELRGGGVDPTAGPDRQA